MSGLFNRKFGSTNLVMSGPVWITAPSVSMAAGVDLVTGSCVCPVPYAYYKLLGLVARINVTTGYSATGTLRVQAVKPSTGAVSTSIWTADSPAFPLNATGKYQVRWWTPQASPTAASSSGYLKMVDGTTGVAFVNTSWPAITTTNGIVSSVNDATIQTSHREFLPELIWTDNLTTGVADVDASFLILPVGKP